MISLRHLLMLALVLLLSPPTLAQFATGVRITLQGTVDSSTSTGFFSTAAPGDPVTITLDVETTTPDTATIFDTSEVYADAVFAASVDVGGTFSDASVTDSEIRVANDLGGFPQSTCGDIFSIDVDVASDYTHFEINGAETTVQPGTSMTYPCPGLLTFGGILTSVPTGSLVQCNLFDGTGVVRVDLTSSSTDSLSNDACADAFALPSGFSTTAFDATGATTDGVDATGFCDYGTFGDEQNHNDVWFTYTPDVSGCTYITTLGLVDWDTRITIYEGAGCPDDPANILACVDDEVLPATGPFEAGLDVDLVAGVTYTIRVGTFESTTVPGEGAIMIAQGPGADVNSGGANPGAPGCSPPPTDLCNGDGGDQMGCTDCPCLNNAPQGTIGGCLNSSFSSARLLVSGSQSVSAADLCFEMSGGIPQSFAILTSGSGIAPGNATNPCFGLNSGIQSISLDGLRCRIGQVFRHGSRGVDAAGFVGPMGPPPNGAWGFCSANFPNFVFAGGDTRYFQVFYREEPAVACMTGLNTSQAVEIALVP